MEKFNFTLKQWVLVRDNDESLWALARYSHYNENATFKHRMLQDIGFRHCIPYEGNEKLLGKRDPYFGPYQPKDGDFIAMGSKRSDDPQVWLCIFKSIDLYDHKLYFHFGLASDNQFLDNKQHSYFYQKNVDYIRPITEEEKQQLLSKLAKIGKEWNPEKKCIEDVWTPKDGDFIIPVDYTESEKLRGLHIYRRKVDNSTDHLGYVGIDFLGHLTFDMFEPWSGTYRLATDSEKQQLLDALHKGGKDWDESKKEIVEYKWKPNTNVKYYYVNSALLVDSEGWTSDLLDEQRYKINNCFRTYDEAQAMADKFKALLKGGEQ